MSDNKRWSKRSESRPFDEFVRAKRELKGLLNVYTVGHVLILYNSCCEGVGGGGNTYIVYLIQLAKCVLLSNLLVSFFTVPELESFAIVLIMM